MLYVRPCRLLRFVERQARDQALSSDATSGHAGRPTGGLDMVLCS